MDEKIRSVLKDITENINLHYSWLDVLSHLELCGARKINSYMPLKGASVDLLQHACEEFRHAYFFKNCGQKLTKGLWVDTSFFNLGFFGRKVYRYLDRLEILVARIVASSLGTQNKESFYKGCYLLTTYVVECRAGVLYRIYDEFLKQGSFPFRLSSILREEKKHLQDIYDDMKKVPEVYALEKKCLRAEEGLFVELLDQVEEAIFVFQRNLDKKKVFC